MTNQGRWIWYPGDFELYHLMKMSLLRDNADFIEVPIWRVYDCWRSVKFRRTAVVETATAVTPVTNGVGFVTLDGKKLPFGRPMELLPGEHTMILNVAKGDGLPCAYIDGGPFATGAGWEADSYDAHWLPAGHSAHYTNPAKTPETFYFAYEPLEPVSAKEINGGVLYDFGKETFARVTLCDRATDAPVRVIYGESESEALDYENAIVRETVTSRGDVTLKSRALRYLFVGAKKGACKIKAEYEYVPFTYRGRFKSSNAKLNRIWDVAAYTFHLTSREFFLDGIKRDRWVWSGDAYQSYLTNYYLFFDNDICKRTSSPLRGKDPVERHINIINDYSLYWIMGVYDYYTYTGDKAFLESIYPKMESLMAYILSRLDSDGFIREIEEDWVFIDWGEIDKTGATCAEQLLLCKALEDLAACASIVAGEGAPTAARYDALAKETLSKIDRYFWSDALGGYIDSFASGQNHVSRQANTFALLFGYAKGDRRQRILQNVLESPAVTPIKTPYFKFYELSSLCQTGRSREAMEQILSYWGGMIDLGATSFWEEYDPSADFPAHYGMYGDPYGKSLCHNWGSNPIYLLGRYFAGVCPTAPGYKTFTVTPDDGGLDWFQQTVPLPAGEVQVAVDRARVQVTATVDGGTLVYGGRSYPLSAGQTVTVER